MSAWARILLMANLLCLTVLTSLIAYQMWDGKQRQTALDSATVFAMITSVEQKLEDYVHGVGNRLDDVEAQRLSDETVREAIKSGIETALADKALQNPEVPPMEPSTYSIEIGDKARSLLEEIVARAGAIAIPAGYQPEEPAKRVEDSVNGELDTEIAGTAGTKATAGSQPLPPTQLSALESAVADVRLDLQAPASDEVAPLLRRGDALQSAAVEPAALLQGKEPGAEARLQEIHFNFGSAELTPGGRRKTLLAASTLMDMQISKIELRGFTDTVGAPALNEALSEKRAMAVAELLREAGVPMDKIEISGRGESGVPEPTDNGVSEPLNRCVGIVAVK